MCVTSVWGCARGLSMSVVSDSLILEFQGVVSHQTWMLRTKLRFSAKIVHALNLELSLVLWA